MHRFTGGAWLRCTSGFAPTVAPVIAILVVTRVASVRVYVNAPVEGLAAVLRRREQRRQQKLLKHGHPVPRCK
jgi:hypothetical protein